MATVWGDGNEAPQEYAARVGRQRTAADRAAALGAVPVHLRAIVAVLVNTRLELLSFWAAKMRAGVPGSKVPRPVRAMFAEVGIVIEAPDDVPPPTLAALPSDLKQRTAEWARVRYAADADLGPTQALVVGDLLPIDAVFAARPRR